MNDEVKNPAVPRSSFKLHRFLFSLLAAISMLLCVATIALWIRSYYYWDRFGRYQLSGKQYSVEDIGSDSGKIMCFRARDLGDMSNLRWHVKSSATEVNLFGSGQFQWDVVDGEVVQIKFPHWLPASLFAILPAICLFRFRSRIPAGRCLLCGYDLRATPERCPECGAVPQLVSPKELR